MLIKPLTLILAYTIPILLFIVFKLQRNKIANSIVKATAIMSIQLSISVFFLTIIFYLDNLLITFIYLLIMTAFSFRTLNSRINKSYQFKKQSRIAVVLAAFTSLLLLILVLSISQNVLSPRYIIPLFGMLLGNISTSVVLASNEIHNILESNRKRIVNLTNLGVPTKVALNEELKNFIIVALTPTLTSMLNIGVVALPGMMTGQILAGEIPLNAVSYQILIMIFISSGSALSTLYLKHAIINSSTNHNNQLL